MNKLKKKKKGWRGAEMTQNTTQQVLQKAAIVKIRLFARFCNSFFFFVLENIPADTRDAASPAT